LRRLVEIVEPARLSMQVARDPDDDALIAVAIAARADLVVSGDEDLLTLGSYAGIAIVDPTSALDLVRRQSS